MNHLRLASTCLVLTLACASCVTTTDGQAPRANVSESEWLQPSPVLRAQIEDQLTRLPWTHGVERVEQIRWLASVGEAAYEQLIPMCLDPRPDVAGSALAALGATGDHRLVEPLRALDWKLDAELPKGLVLERSRTFVRLGDWEELQVLIDGLGDEELWTRAWCSQALFEATQHRFGYDPKAEPEVRAESIERWQKWLDSRRVEGILPNAIAARR